MKTEIDNATDELMNKTVGVCTHLTVKHSPPYWFVTCVTPINYLPVSGEGKTLIEAIRVAIMDAKILVGQQRDYAAILARRKYLPKERVAAADRLIKHLRAIPPMSEPEARHNCEWHFGPIPPAVWELLCKTTYLC